MNLKFQPKADPPMAEIENLKLKIKNSRQGFSLIELMVAMFIFVMIMGAMVAVSVAGFRSYGKSKAIKIVTEDVGFAMNSIAKDVRMGKIETTYSDGSPQDRIILSRNRGGKVCYEIGIDYLGVDDTTGDCSSTNKIVDLSGTGMSFDSTSAFYSCPSTFGIATKCPSSVPTAENRRGWVGINLNIESPTMETDSIHVQTIVSSRDYGWETP